MADTKNAQEEASSQEEVQAKDFLMDKGYDPDFGARPLKRCLEQYIEDPLAEDLLREDFKPGDTITATVKDDRLSFKTTAEEPEQKEAATTPA